VRKSRIAAMVAAMAVAMIAASPALADTELADTGQVGRHSLRDSFYGPGASCDYKSVGGDAHHYFAQLTRLKVRAPVVRASSGEQTVAWRFQVVRRRYTGNGQDVRATKVTYLSPWQSAVATNDRNARFTKRSVNVTVPRDGRPGGSATYTYEVDVQMAWYRFDELTGDALHRVDWYKPVYHDTPNWFYQSDFTDDAPCYSRFGVQHVGG
jgi:hypothetical protein